MGRTETDDLDGFLGGFGNIGDSHTQKPLWRSRDDGGQGPEGFLLDPSMTGPGGEETGCDHLWRWRW